MKSRNLIPVFGLILLMVFTFFIVRFTNYSLKRTYQESCSNTFYLLSFLVDRYLKDESELTSMRIEELREEAAGIARYPTTISPSVMPRGVQGLWISSQDSLRGITDYATIEDEIINFYAQNLRTKNSHSLIMVDGQPFFLINSLFDDAEVLLLSEAQGIAGMRVHTVLDSLVVTSNLKYFAVLDKNQTPVLFSTLYENFLPLRGTGYHTIETPAGNIFQIEGTIFDKTFVAGFTMASLERITFANNIFLISVIILFTILEGVLIFNFLRFERFRARKEREIHLLKEIGALSTGFAHEFRNSLHTLSLLYKDLHDEEKRILTEETDRMTSIMNSLRVIGITEIAEEKINVREIIDESISLLRASIKDNGVTIKTDVPDTLTTRGNRLLLVTAFSNIVKNSIEADARTISIETIKKGKEIHIDCVDDGKGIDEQIVDKIFEPFFSKKGQSGIGLYLVKRIVELHSGTVAVNLDKNTQFRITLKEQ
jgi:signal transduction histidine kinase